MTIGRNLRFRELPTFVVRVGIDCGCIWVGSAYTEFRLGHGNSSFFLGSGVPRRRFLEGRTQEKRSVFGGSYRNAFPAARSHEVTFAKKSLEGLKEIEARICLTRDDPRRARLAAPATSREHGFTSRSGR